MCMRVCLDCVSLKLLKEHYIYIRKLHENKAVNRILSVAFVFLYYGIIFT